MSTPSCAAGLGDEASPSPTPCAPPHSAPLTHSASWECLSTLPTNGSPLRHVTHVRPRPPRRHRAAHFPPESVSRRDLSPSVNVSGQSPQGTFSRCDTSSYSSSTFKLDLSLWWRWVKPTLSPLKVYFLVTVWQLSVNLCYFLHFSCQWHFPKISS